MLAEKPIFLHYTKAELDRNFDQRGWIANAEAIIARHIERSRGTREKLAFVPDLRYGKHPDEVLDYFPAERKGAPIQVFVHGGAWKNFGKNDYSFPAEGFVPAGVSTAILNFSKLPHVRLPVLVDQVPARLRGFTRMLIDTAAIQSASICPPTRRAPISPPIRS